jgi:hypothetical protein
VLFKQHITTTDTTDDHESHVYEHDYDDNAADDDSNANCCCGCVISLPLMYCLFSYFINKLLTEAVVSSAPLMTQYLFNWNIGQVS